ncbi:hypothetical protein [Ferruginibacter sp. SUN106]|uniref:hypothetical protein n=1 Tax=Ferruginibacter sp. SUN106 TaxID=2978348 RepID=UPI003D35BEB2
MKGSITKSVAALFTLLGVLFIPFPFNITTLQLQVTDFIFGKLIGITAKVLFGKALSNTTIYSDSISMYILLLILFAVAVIIVLILSSIKKWQLYSEKIFRILYQLFIYYLALQLLKYGADKIFKNQFYTPEPNTLYTPMGQLQKDILYWSTMGTSYTYNIFLGSLEILGGVLILIKRTRLIGLLLSSGILVNVVAVNFSFDISVKLYSSFLLFLDIYLLHPFGKRLYQLLLQKNITALPATGQTTVFKKTFAIAFLQWLAIGLIVLEVFYPFVMAGNFNGDKTPRPYLHGAYEVRNIIEGKDTLASSLSPVKRFFIHRGSYIIFQDQGDIMKDYKLSYDKADTTLTITDYEFKQTVLSYTYQTADSILTLEYLTNDKPIKLIGKAINWRKLPALQKNFHWTMDGMQ